MHTPCPCAVEWHCLWSTAASRTDLTYNINDTCPLHIPSLATFRSKCHDVLMQRERHVAENECYHFLHGNHSALSGTLCTVPWFWISSGRGSEQSCTAWDHRENSRPPISGCSAQKTYIMICCSNIIRIRRDQCLCHPCTMAFHISAPRIGGCAHQSTGRSIRKNSTTLYYLLSVANEIHLMFLRFFIFTVLSRAVVFSPNLPIPASICFVSARVSEKRYFSQWTLYF